MADVLPQQKQQPTANVHKFGGSSLQDAEHIEQVVQVIRTQVRPDDYIVVSANGKVTDYLLDILRGEALALERLEQYMNDLIRTVLRHPEELLGIIKNDCEYISKLGQGCTENNNDVLALGELWSAQLLSVKLSEHQLPNHWIDARQFLQVDENMQLINAARTRRQLLQLSRFGETRYQPKQFHIVTGFIAKDTAGQNQTLGRNGSDYSATLIAALLCADTVYLWTDVDGVYTADPKHIEQARLIEKLSTCEAQALSELGSDVLHHKTITPALRHDVRIRVNTCGAASNGTLIEKRISALADMDHIAVKTLTKKSALEALVIDQVDAFFAGQLLQRFSALQVNFYAHHFDVTQHTLTFCVEKNDLFKCVNTLKSHGLSVLSQVSGISLVGAVGQNIKQNHQVVNQVLEQAAAFEVQRIHYPQNNHSLCVLLPDAQASQLLRAWHEVFFASAAPIPVVIIGLGNIGKQLLKILQANKTKIESSCGQSMSLVAIANSQYYQINSSCLLTQNIALNQSNQQGEVFHALKKFIGKPAVIIDVTASEEVAEQYLTWADNGWHIISANKVAAADRKWAQAITSKLKQNKLQWMKNTTVGAALPIQKTIKEISASGDQIRRVSGVFSGSLSWLLGKYDGQTEFMEWVKRAQENALTEPDPRADLSGQDVYRKALILCHELGFKPSKVVFEPVVSKDYLTESVAGFWQNQTAINNDIKSLWQTAQQNKQQLRYLAAVSADELRVSLVAVDDDHAASRLKPGDNIFIIESEWYDDNPLIIQGPGAGREVTAAGVLTDLLEVLQTK